MLKPWLQYSIVLYILILWSCASQTTPMGGPKDETPPKLLNSDPVNKSINFDGKTISLTFDENVVLNNPKDEILISPAIDKNREFKVKKNKVTIFSPEGLKDSTTYSISFREGIRDLTENNPPANLKLAFSTGPFIDSMTITGRITQPLNETIPSNITIALFQADTFNIFLHSPNYFTITDKSGTFSLENIKAGTYHIYAFEDRNKNLKVESRTERFGFLSKSLNVDTNVDSLVIPIIKLDTRQPKINNIRNNGLYTSIKWNKPITDFTLENASSTPIINTFGDDQSEIILYNPDLKEDSLQFKISASDSLRQTVDSTFYIKKTIPNFIPSDFTVTSGILKYDLKTNSLKHSVTLNKPLLKINFDSLYIEIDSLHRFLVDSSEISYDTINKILYLKKPITIDSLYKKVETIQSDSVQSKSNPKTKEVRSRTITQTTKPILIYGRGGFISQELDSSKAKKYDIIVIDKEKTGTLLVEANTKHPHYVIQLLTSSNEVISEVRNTDHHIFDFLPPQNYKLRVIIDDNDNGVWDPGNIFENKEPESTYYYKTAENKYEFPIRANWELGPLMLIF